MANTPQKATLTSTTTIKWSGGRNFDGYVLLLMSLPTSGGAAWTQVALINQYQKLRIPTRIKVPIRDGVYATDTQIWRTDSIVPPNVQYTAFWYDSTDRLIASGGTLFTVAVSSYVLDPPALTDPTLSVSIPVPEDVPSTNITTTFFQLPTVEDVGGTKNGVNTAFTISKAGTTVVLIWNGLVLESGIQYTISGANITMLGTNLPNVGDTFVAMIWSS